MKKRRLDFNYKPLTMLKAMEVINNIPQHQLYNTLTGEYTPDYTLQGLGLAIQPHITAAYTDGTGQNTEVTASENLTNIKWTEIASNVNGQTTTTVITASTPGYTIITSGANKCRLILSKNLTVGCPLTLRFECDYLDTRTSDIHHVIEETQVTVAVTESVPSFYLDRPGTTLFNPFGDVYNGVRSVLQQIVYNASLKLDGEEMPVSKREFRWEKKRPNGSWTVIGDEDYKYMDLGWSISNDGATFTQSTKCIGEKTEMRVRVRYGDLTTATFNTASPTEYFTMARRLPDYDYDYVGVPDNLETDVDIIHPEAIVTDRYGNVDDYIEELMPRWYTGAGSVTGATNLELVATGRGAGILTSKINQHGMILALDMEQRTADRGNYKVVVDDVTGLPVVETINGVEHVVISK